MADLKNQSINIFANYYCYMGTLLKRGITYVEIRNALIGESRHFLFGKVTFCNILELIY